MLILGIYEIFFGFKTLWDIPRGHQNSIIFSGQIIQGMPATTIFFLIGVFLLFLGYGIIKLRPWAYYGFIAYNGLLILLHCSNLLLVGTEDLILLYGSVQTNYLLGYRLDIFRRLLVTMILVAAIFYYRKQFMNEERLTITSTPTRE